MQTRFRKDWPRILFLFGFFFLMGGYGHTAEVLAGNVDSLVYAISGIMAAVMLSIGVYFVVVMGRQMLAKYKALFEPHISSLSKKLAT